MDEVWSNTDFPYMCLKDEVRTEAFKKAIHEVVKKGDVVIDVGSGSGILSFFAARAGAKKIYAVEIEPLLVDSLRKSILANGFENVIEVVKGDISKVDLPKNIDCVIAEIIETGLLDELQVPAINRLRQQGVITDKTSIIPFHYKTFVQLIFTDNNYYGYKIYSPKHEWPFYAKRNSGWFKTKIKPVSEALEIVSADFSLGVVEENVSIVVQFKVNKGEKVNGIKISGLIQLSKSVQLGATNALNGDKIIPFDEVEGLEIIKLKISYKMGGGLGNFKVLRLPPT